MSQCGWGVSLQNLEDSIKLTVISENRPTLKNQPTPFLNEGIAKGAFLLKVQTAIYAALHAVVLSRKFQRSSTVQGED